jgi:hypothetical protein
MSKSERQRELAEQVRRVAALLRSDWDPIGQGEIPDLPDDEYDSYAPILVSMVSRGLTDAELVERLLELEREVIGAASAADLYALAREIRRAVRDESPEV